MPTIYPLPEGENQGSGDFRFKTNSETNTSDHTEKGLPTKLWGTTHQVVPIHGQQSQSTSQNSAKYKN